MPAYTLNASPEQFSAAVFSELPVFAGISAEELNRMLHCFQVTCQHFEKGEIIHTYTRQLEKIGVLLSGKAHLYCIDDDGTYTLLERFSRDDLFGELFSLPLTSLEYLVEADAACEVLFIDYARVIHPCSNACAHHAQLTDNLFQLITRKSQAQSLRINLLTAKTIRQKLLHYMNYMRNKTGSRSFRMDMSLTELAAYLGVDRSSMMRELRALKTEGFLESRGREVCLLEADNSFFFTDK